MPVPLPRQIGGILLPSGAGMDYESKLARVRAAQRQIAMPPAPNVYGTTLGSQIARWYERTPGGLAGAVDAAQQAMGSRDRGILPNHKWTRWSPQDVLDKRATLDVYPRPGAPYLGQYDPMKGEVYADPRSEKFQTTLEHELSHHAYADSDQTYASPSSYDGYPSAMNSEQDFVAYVLTPVETDVRLAEVKRRYAHATGRLVTTPEEAQRAWDWFMRTSGEQQKQYYSGPNESSSGLYEMELNWTPEQRKQAMHRMPELVASPVSGLLRS